MDIDKSDAFEDLEEMFGDGSINRELEEQENVILTQDLEDFAGIFPDWDLLPPASSRR